ncbi:MAG TPA: PAS domain-containing protein, partial [Candidatus Saccharibacteria bacterium]|nr:PAS domain-containing protein [Candidatus Saccharibacteria bacterium]
MAFGGKKSKKITEQAETDRLLTIINNLADATFSTDETGKILMYNAASLDLLDTNQDLTGKQLGTLFKLHDGDDNKINMSTLLKEATKETRRDDLHHTYSDGESIRIELTYAPIKSSFSKHKGETIIGYVLIARDITKQKSLEEERDEFISVISHELRTPITIVEGDISNIQLMLDQPKLPDLAVVKKALKSSHDHIL